MMTALTMTAICLGVLNLALALALASRLRTLRPAAESHSALLPRLGRTLPPFDLVTTDGRRLTEAFFADAPALACFFLPDCPGCKTVQEELFAAKPALPTVIFISAGPQEAAEEARRLEPIGTVACFEDAKVRESFGVVAFPTVLRVERGVITASGTRLAQVMPT